MRRTPNEPNDEPVPDPPPFEPSAFEPTQTPTFTATFDGWDPVADYRRWADVIAQEEADRAVREERQRQAWARQQAEAQAQDEAHKKVNDEKAATKRQNEIAIQERKKREDDMNSEFVALIFGLLGFAFFIAMVLSSAKH